MQESGSRSQGFCFYPRSYLNFTRRGATAGAEAIRVAALLDTMGEGFHFIEEGADFIPFGTDLPAEDDVPRFLTHIDGQLLAVLVDADVQHDWFSWSMMVITWRSSRGIRRTTTIIPGGPPSFMESSPRLIIELHRRAKRYVNSCLANLGS